MTGERISIAMIIPGGIGTGKNNLGVPVLERLVRLLSKNFDVTVFSLFKVNSDYRPEGFVLVDVSHRITAIRFTKLLLSVRQNHKQRPFRVVHGFWALPSGLFAVMLGRMLGIKSIVSVLGGDAIALPEIKYGQLQRPVSRKLILWTLHRADEVVVLTNYLLNNLKNAGLKKIDVKIIPWGIETELFSFQSKQLNTPVQFLHIANLHPVKDQHTLLRAFKLISEEENVHLTLIGEGVLEEQIRSFALSLRLHNISFVSPLPYEQLPHYYKNADILLHTSLSEGQSEVVTEAMSSGVLVCGTKVGLMYDEPSCCISVEVGDHVALANKILKLLNDPESFRQVQENARRWAHDHSIDWTVYQLAKLYSS